MRVGFLHSLIRKDEKLLIAELRRRDDIELVFLDDRKLVFDLRTPPAVDDVMERCINHSRAMHALRLFEGAGLACVNRYEVSRRCGDKILTTASLRECGVPQPEARVAFTEEAALEAALEAIEELGYPVVLKPAVGSWGRLLSRINDRDAAETVLEHKSILGSYHHSIFFVQKYVEKGGRDIRTFVVGNDCIAAVYRTSEHWITNTARGGQASNCPVTSEIGELSLRASIAGGSGLRGRRVASAPAGASRRAGKADHLGAPGRTVRAPGPPEPARRHAAPLLRPR